MAGEKYLEVVDHMCHTAQCICAETLDPHCMQQCSICLSNPMQGEYPNYMSRE
jgi:hypothetical protein